MLFHTKELLKMTPRDGNTSPPPNALIELSLLNAWLDAADSGLLVLDEASTAILVNRTAGLILGFEPVELVNQPISRLLANAEQRAQLVLWMHAAQDNDERYVTFQLPAVNGRPAELRQCLIKLSQHAVAGKNYKIAALSDVTQLLASQAELESLKRQWQALNAGVVVADATQPDLPIVFVNDVFQQMTGYSNEEILGRNCRFLQRDDLDQPGLHNIRRALLAKTNGYGVVRNYRKDGSMFWNELFISPVRNESGLVTHFVGIQHLRDSDQPSAWPTTPAALQ